MAERNFHFEIRDASKHELVGLIESYSFYIKSLISALGTTKILTPEELWNKLQEEKRRRKL